MNWLKNKEKGEKEESKHFLYFVGFVVIGTIAQKTGNYNYLWLALLLSFVLETM